MDPKEPKDIENRNEGTPEQPSDGKVAGASPYLPRLTRAEIRQKDAKELMPYFKDVRGKWRTVSLFEETCDDPAKYPPIFTLQDDDTASCVSLKRLYFAFEDLTEFKFATHCLGGWDHWEALLESTFVLRPEIDKWRRDLELHLKSKYLNAIAEIAHTDGPVGLQANKYLLETLTGGGANKKASKRGRPSKEEKEAALAEELRDSEEIRRDMERLGIKVVK